MTKESLFLDKRKLVSGHEKLYVSCEAACSGVSS